MQFVSAYTITTHKEALTDDESTAEAGENVWREAEEKRMELKPDRWTKERHFAVL